MLNKDEMMDAVARQFGLEADVTVWFFRACELLDDIKTVRALFDAAMEMEMEVDE